MRRLRLAGENIQYYDIYMERYERIIRECFWDLRISDDDIRETLNSDDNRKKRQLFERILLNSSRYLLDLHLFDRENLYGMLGEYQVPKFNHYFAFRRKNIAEVFFFDKELKVEELKWTA
jgi:hypothetical protein